MFNGSDDDYNDDDVEYVLMTIFPSNLIVNRQQDEKLALFQFILCGCC